MSEKKPRLADFPQAVATLLPVMEALYPPAIVTDPTQMLGEDARLKFAGEAGKHLVLMDFRAALSLANREVKKDRVKEEII